MLYAAIVLSTFAIVLGLFVWTASGMLNPSDYRKGTISIVETTPDESAGVSEFAILTYNIGYASGLANNTAQILSSDEYVQNVQQIIDTLQRCKPDIVALQEVDYGSKRSAWNNQMDRIADALCLPYRACAYNWDARHVPFPHWPLKAHFGRVLSGQAILSRFPLRDQTVHILPKPKENSYFYNAYYPDRLAQSLTVDLPQGSIEVVNVHLEAYRTRGRELQAVKLAEVIAALETKPAIVLGDFNALPPWAEHHIAAELDVESGDRPRDAVLSTVLAVEGFQSAMRDRPEASTYTFRADRPRVAIDHILYRGPIECRNARVIDDAGVPSDHLPLEMRFRYSGQSQHG